MPDRINAITEAVKAAPPVVVSGSMLFGMTPAEWVTALTVLYLILQIGLLLPKYISHLKNIRNKKKNDKQ